MKQKLSDQTYYRDFKIISKSIDIALFIDSNHLLPLQNKLLTK